MKYLGIPLIRSTTPEERNELRKAKWQNSNKPVRFLLMFIWLDKLFICGLLTFACFASGTAILSLIPIFFGLKFLTEPPFGLDQKSKTI